MRFNDAVLGTVLLAFSVLVGWWSQSFPAIPGQQYGAAVFPTLVAVALGGCSLVLIVSGLRQGGALVLRDEWAESLAGPARVVLVLASVVFFVLAVDPLGFIPTMTLVLVLDLRLLGVRWPTTIAVAVAMSFLLQWSFGDLLHVPLPWGVLSAYRF